ncbi:MAG: hypothetical protein LKJ90_08930 [Faecalibacterium sp.]|nr:hypothetical protein [Faecalibacterium sp.]
MTNSKEETVIAALLTSPTVAEASKRCGVSVRTIYHMRQRPDFQKQYSAAKAKIISDATAYLQSKMQGAADTVTGIMADPLAPPYARVQAARAVFDYGIKLGEQNDILNELARLREVVEDGVNDE